MGHGVGAAQSLCLLATARAMLDRAVQADFGGFDQKLRRCAMKFMHHLLMVALLRVAAG